MSARVKKRSRPCQRNTRQARADYVFTCGIEIPACSYCFSLGYDSCRRVNEIRSCHRCIEKQKSCDGIQMSDLKAIMKEQTRLREKKVQTQKEVDALHAEFQRAVEDYKAQQAAQGKHIESLSGKISEKINRIRRLETQDEFLHKRAISILRQEEEWDQEELEAQRVEAERASSSGFVVADSNVPEFDWDALNSPSQWEVDPALLALVGPGSAGGTGQPSAGQSSDVP
jgi:hypothetical protein